MQIGMFQFARFLAGRTNTAGISIYFIGTKNIYSYDDVKEGKINNWLRDYHDKESSIIGIMHNNKTDFQHNVQVVITSDDNKDHTAPITTKNLMEMSIYFSVRKCIKATWLNDRDQFLYPNDGWKTDKMFQNDCLAYTLFNTNISSSFGINHWIPFTEYEIDAKEKFESNFMTQFIKGKLKSEEKSHLFDTEKERTTPLVFSVEATAVFDAGRDLWKYYHKSIKNAPYAVENNGNVNASFYDIRAYFQGRNDKDRMNSKSDDETYNELLKNLREKLKQLAEKIEPKVYGYGFLKQ